MGSTVVVKTSCRKHRHPPPWARPQFTRFFTRLSAKKKARPASSSGSGFGASSSATPKTRSLGAAQGSGAGTKALRQAANAFDRIRRDCGISAIRDVYVRSPKNSPTTFWFVGKVACATAVEVSGEDDGGEVTDDAPSFRLAAVAQKRLILEYAKGELRPQNMAGPSYAPFLELWLAPGNSEMDVVQNKVDLVKVIGSASDLPDNYDLSAIGYNPEIYVGDERVKGGLRVERNEHGKPTKPAFEITQSVEGAGNEDGA